jgi:hypothetical protein
VQVAPTPPPSLIGLSGRPIPETSPPPLQCGERPDPASARGVARLLAVANLTVKTNIRTARRGTLEGAMPSATTEVTLGAWWACKTLAARRSYAQSAKLDKFSSAIANHHSSETDRKAANGEEDR